MPLSALFVLGTAQEVLMEKHWEAGLDRSLCDVYWRALAAAGGDAAAVPPVLASPRAYVLHCGRDGVVLLGLVRREHPPAAALSFLAHVGDVLARYCGGRLREEALRESFATIVQVLDEIADSGVPFVSEPAVLLEMLPPPKLVDRLAAAVTGSAQKSMKEKLPDIATSMVTWRSPKVKYAANEIYFDIVDTVDATTRLDGRLVSCEVRSTIEANCKLSGMPDLTMAFADTSPLRDARFHPCVRVKRFRSDGVLSFVPPDGSFRLADFCPPAPKGGLLPIYMTPQFAWEIVEAGARSGGDVAGEQGQGSPGGSSAGGVGGAGASQATCAGGRLSVMVGVKQDVGRNADGIVVTVPFPPAWRVASAVLSANVGSVSWDAATKTATWAIGKIPNDRAPCLSGDVRLEEGAPPPEGYISLRAAWKLLGTSVSGLRIESLKFDNIKYTPYKGSRSLAVAGTYEVRS